MKIALTGTGQMGDAVASMADGRGHEVVATFNSKRPLLEAGPSAVADAEAVIDFSLPHLAVEHIRRYAEWQVPAVIGTTGWYDNLDEAREIVESSSGTLLYAPNFSLGVAVLSRAVRSVLPLLDRLDHFDAYVHETHHTKKKDSPSGTGLMLAEAIVSGLRRKNCIETETVHGLIDTDTLHVSSTRAGSVFGRHVVGFDSEVDELMFEHRAKSRRGFALGAVRAAEWLIQQKGFYSLDDALDQWIGER